MTFTRDTAGSEAATSMLSMNFKDYSWIQAELFLGSDGTGDRHTRLVGKWFSIDDAQVSAQSMVYTDQGVPKISFNIWNDNALYWVDVSAAFDTWYQVKTEYAGDAIHFYLNGRLEGTYQIPAEAMGITDGDLWIGSWINANATTVSIIDNVYAGNSKICTDYDSDGYYAEAGCDALIDCDDNDGNSHPNAG